MKCLRGTGRLILTPKKLNEKIDFGSIYPKGKIKAHLEYPIKRDFVGTSFINEVSTKHDKEKRTAQKSWKRKI